MEKASPTIARTVLVNRVRVTARFSMNPGSVQRCGAGRTRRRRKGAITGAPSRSVRPAACARDSATLKGAGSSCAGTTGARVRRSAARRARQRLNTAARSTAVRGVSGTRARVDAFAARSCEFRWTTSIAAAAATLYGADAPLAILRMRVLEPYLFIRTGVKMPRRRVPGDLTSATSGVRWQATVRSDRL